VVSVFFIAIRPKGGPGSCADREDDRIGNVRYETSNDFRYTIQVTKPIDAMETSLKKNPVTSQRHEIMYNPPSPPTKQSTHAITAVAGAPAPAPPLIPFLPNPPLPLCAPGFASVYLSRTRQQPEPLTQTHHADPKQSNMKEKRKKEKREKRKEEKVHTLQKPAPTPSYS
jgi:hypothetical protein